MLKILALPVLLCIYPVHITMTSIDFIPGTDSLKVIVRMDYELYLHDYQQTVNDDIDLQTLRSYNPFPSDLANNYINSKLSIFLNNELLIGKLLNMKVVDSDINFFVLYRVRHKLKSITIRNNFLTGLYSDVENLTLIKIKNTETGIKFTQNYREKNFVFR